MKDRVNRPYSRSGYTESSYSTSEYGEAIYSASDYSGTDYRSATYESGASMKEELIGKINIKDAVVGVVGLGYVGLPLAVEVADAGYRVLGVDVGARVVDRVNRGDSHVGDVPSARLASVVQSGKLTASTDYAVLAEADCVSIAVPTPLTKTKEPDITFITSSVNALLPHLHEGMLVVLESTTYPGTTEELIASRIEEEAGLKVGEKIFVAFSPERVDPGNEKWGTKNTPKVIGGVTPACAEVARAFYAAVLDTVHVVGSAREAETVKLLENTFRAVNIGLVNEFLLMCNRMDIDVWNVVEAAATKPFGFMSFSPGPGIGGHCIPLDPMYMSWKAKAVDFYNRFIELATDLNGNMPRFVISKLGDMLNDCEKPLKGSRIMILGMAYKKDIDDLRESPGLEIYRLLREKGAWVEFSDPHAESFVSMLGNTVESTPLDEGVLETFDAAVLVTDHSAFDYGAIARSTKCILDCRNAFSKRGVTGDNIVKL